MTVVGTMMTFFTMLKKKKDFVNTTPVSAIQQVLTPLVRCLATFAGFGWNSFSDAELGTSNVAACLGKLLKSPYLHLRRECLWLLNNLAGRWSIRP